MAVEQMFRKPVRSNWKTRQKQLQTDFTELRPSRRAIEHAEDRIVDLVYDLSKGEVGVVEGKKMRD